MRRTSVSDQLAGTRPFPRFLFHTLYRGVCAGVLAFALTVGASVASFADDGTDDDSGRLNLNSDVLVNESVGTGATGDFAIRGRLFSPQLSARSHALDVASSTRLAVAGGLDFRLPESTDAEYRALRGGLFNGYSVKALPARGATQETSSALYGLLLIAGVPLVLLGGVLLGRFWVGRKRATA